jgi:diguanylate cyclase (GGDEF)-like protein
VSEIGTHWNLDRSIAALRKPGLAVSVLKEFVSSGGKAGDTAALNKLICGLQELILTRGPLVYSEVASASELKDLAPQLSLLGGRSLLALPLTDGNDQLGVLLLLSSAPRSWTPNEVLVFKMIAEQVAIALSNAGLRRLVKNLSVTDENSGLLKRASYLDLLLGEVRRARQQNSALSVLLMRFGGFTKDSADTGESTIQRIGQLVAANVRQNDLAFRYATNAVAIVLGETADKEAQLVVEKMRRLIANAISEKQIAASFNAGIAEAVTRGDYDPVDIVTELINRAEQALEKSVADGPGKSATLAPNLSAAAVA